MPKIMWTPDHGPICVQSWRNFVYNVFVCRSSMIFLGRGLIGILHTRLPFLASVTNLTNAFVEEPFEKNGCFYSCKCDNSILMLSE